MTISHHAEKIRQNRKITPRDGAGHITIRDMLARFDRPRKTGTGWQARCPAHDDRHASLSIGEGQDGRILMYCHAGCTTEDVTAALGVAMSELSPAREAQASQRASAPGKRIVATYDYRDERGTLLYQAVRFEPKRFSQRAPDGHGGWRWHLSGVERVLYRLPELLAANPQATVFIVEGEKDVDALTAAGLTATCNVGGAGKWRDAYSAHLRGRDVVILPDHDEPGRRHAAKVAQSLAGVAASIRVLALPGLALKGDVSDWLAAGGDAERLCVMADAAPDWTPAPATADTITPDDAPAVSVRRLADVEPESVTWLWHPYIPLGKLTLMEGDPGVGKSFVSCGLATAVAAGRGLDGMMLSAPGNVLILSAEDGLADTLRPRLDGMGADVTRIYALDEPITFDEQGLLMLDAAITEYRPVLVIIDPLQSYLGASVDMHRANETRPVLARLAAIAAREQCAMLAIRHLAKAGASKAIYRGLGSIDFTAAARSVLLAGEDPDTGQRAIVQLKNNLAMMGAAIGYRLDRDGFAWTGPCDLTADRILRGQAERQNESSGRREAEDFLRAALEDGEMPAQDVQRLAREAGISAATLRRAKDALGIQSAKLGGRYGGQPGWVWRLPEDAHLPAEDAHKLADEHLQANHSNKTSYGNGLAEDAHLPICEHLQAGT